MNFTDEERALLAALAEVLIPAGEGFPSAGEAGVAGEGLDKVLSFRSDLGQPLKELLASARGRSPAEFVASLRQNDPAAFSVLADLVPGAYFLNAGVREKLGYNGQTPRTIDPRPDFLEDGLLQSVIGRGPIYRPTRER